MTVNTLGAFLRDRRARLLPPPDAPGRRRTPGLRREEVATRAAVSITWYTWLEQGRGGPPSDDVLERLAQALELDATGREMLFLLAQQRPPPLTPGSPSPVSSTLQGVLDALTTSPAVVKTPLWDIVAWNAAATAVLTDYTLLPAGERNLLRRLFSELSPTDRWPDWESDARFALAAFRFDMARAGGSPEAVALADELQARSDDFRRMWADNEVSRQWVGRKRLEHPVAGPISLEYSTFAVDGAEGLSMVVFTPSTPEVARAIAALLAQ
jgi:transcriptional regulator with XRE-family HTH domain